MKVTIATTTIPNWKGQTSNLFLVEVVNTAYTESVDFITLQPGRVAGVVTGSWYAKTALTVDVTDPLNHELVIPAIIVDSTVDGIERQDATVSFFIVDQNMRVLESYEGFTRVRIPAVSSTTWNVIRSYNYTTPLPGPTSNYYNKAESDFRYFEDPGAVTDGYVWSYASGNWGAHPNPAGFINPMTTAGDLIAGGSAGVATRLPIGTPGQVPTVNPGGTGLVYATPTGGVTSAFGRSGAVVATEGDYTFGLLGDVTLTSPASGQVPQYNGTAWVNHALVPGDISGFDAQASSAAPVQSVAGRTGAVVVVAGDIASGVFATARIPDLSATYSVVGHTHAASDVTSGTFNIARIPDLSSLYQPLDSDLTALAALSTTGFIKRTGSGTATAASLVAGDIPDLSATYQPLDSDLSAIAALSTTGFVKRTGSGTATAASLVSGDIPDLSATYSVVGHTHAGSDIVSGTVPATQLGSGTPSSSNFLRGDGSWQSIPGGFVDPMTTVGDTIMRDGSNVTARLAGNTTTTRKFMTQTGNGSISAAPAWNALTGSDLNALSLADLGTRSAADLSSGTLPDARFPATLPAASGVNLTSLNATNLGSGTVPDARFPATLPAASGVNLTALNASNIASGTLADARLTSNVFLVDGTRAGVSSATTGTAFELDATSVTSGILLKGVAHNSGFTGSIIKVVDDAGSPATLFQVSNAGAITTGTIPYGSVTSKNVVNSDVASNAAIAYSKLNLATSIVNGDISASAAIGWAKVDKTGSSLADLATRSAADLTTGTLSDLRQSSNIAFLDGTRAFTGVVGGVDPTSSNHLATKNYVDALANGLQPKAPVRVATTASITLSGTQTIDGVSVAAGERVLVKNQSTGSQNGIYICASGAWSRSADADASSEVLSGLSVWVDEGTTNADSQWVLTTDGTITLGTTTLTFTQVSGLGQVTDGAGLTKTGNTLNVGGTSGRISVGTDTIDIDSAYVGQTSITTLGTIGTGSWNATAIPWAKVDKTGSSLADLATRSAADLSTGSLSDLRLSANVPLLNAANSFTAAQTQANGTITTMQPFMITQTWNQGATAFAAFKINITDTASAAGSWLEDLQVASVSKWSVDKSGNVTAAGRFNSAAVTNSSPTAGDFWYDSAQLARASYVDGIKQYHPGVIFTSTADQAIGPSVTAETTMLNTSGAVGSLSLPANFLTVGKMIHVVVRGLVSTAASSPGTGNVKLKLGSTVLCTNGSPQTIGTSQSNQVFVAEAWLTCRTTGATGTVSAIGYYSENADNNRKSFSTTSTTVDTTASQVLDFTFTFGTSSASNIITVQQSYVEVLN